MAPKKSLIFSAVLFAVSSLRAAVANTVTAFSAARLVGGLAIGLASVLTPVYIAEISPSKNRGTLVSLNQLAIVIGILSAYLVNWRLLRLGEASWRWMLAVAAVPSLAFLVGLLAIPESPANSAAVLSPPLTLCALRLDIVCIECVS